MEYTTSKKNPFTFLLIPIIQFFMIQKKMKLSNRMCSCCPYVCGTVSITSFHASLTAFTLTPGDVQNIFESSTCKLTEKLIFVIESGTVRR